MLNRVSLALVFGVFLAASPAQAALFTIDSYSVTVNDQDPGLVLWQSPLPADLEFNLENVGDTHETKLFRLGTNEGAYNSDDATTLPITVDFTFSTPGLGFNGVAQGLTGAFEILWILEFASLEWDNPYVFDFGNTGKLGVSLTSGLFGLPGSMDVSARFKLLAADTGTPAPVPEPATVLLMSLGAGAMAAVRRRQSRSQS